MSESLLKKCPKCGSVCRGSWKIDDCTNKECRLSDSNKTKHTPGPWVIETYHGSLFKICKPDFRVGDEVAHRLEADARLIAAAPDLLHALQEFVNDAPVDSKNYYVMLFRNLINKATGGAK